MQEMEKLQAKGEVNEDILHAMEEDMTGKVHISRRAIPCIQSASPCTTDLARLLAGNSF